MSRRLSSIVFALVVALGCNAVHADETVLLKLGDVEITQEEYSRLIKSVLSDDQRKQLFSDEKHLRELLADYFVTRVLAQEAIGMGLDTKDEMQFMRHYNWQRLLSQARMKQLEEDAAPLDYEALAREAYLSEPDQFKRPEMISAEHILVSTGERSEKDAKARIDEVQAMLLAGQSFSELAKEYSDDPSAASNAGALGYFPKGQMVKPFEEAAFGMKEKGELAIVKTDFGYHLIRFIDRREASMRTFEEVKDELVSRARQQHMKDLRTTKIESIRSSGEVKANLEAVSDFYKENQKTTR